MPTVSIASGLNLYFQETGPKDKPVVILIMGLGAQLTVWPDSLFYGLAERGYRVIRFDNRDTGLSSHLNDMGSPNLFKLWLSKHLPIDAPAPYQLEDMAKDVVHLMKALKIKRAHLVGASMGGTIAKIVAAKHRKKVVSLTSIMSTSSYSSKTRPKLKVMLKLASRPRKGNREAAIHYTVKLNQTIGSPKYPTEESKLRKQATGYVERAYNPDGYKRQLAALTSGEDRRHLARKIKAPTLIIHGTDDPILPVSCGQQSAKLITQSKLKLVDGMGHDFPAPLMAKMTKWIGKHIKKSERKRLAQKRQRTKP